MKDFNFPTIIVFAVAAWLFGCAADGSFKIPSFGFGDKDGRQGECAAISETMQRCKYIRPNGKFYWLELPIIIIEPQEDVEEKV